MKILIYVKAGLSYGFGHLSRSISLVNHLKQHRVQFLLYGDERAASILKDNDIIFDLVKNDEELFSLIEGYKPNLLITDVRDTGIDFMKRLIALTKVLSIDDLGAGNRLADIVVNILPKPPDVSSSKANFEGTKYLVLSNKLTKYKSRLREVIDKPTLLVSFGGEDPYSLTSFAYDILFSLKDGLDIDIKIVLGPLYKGRKEFPEAFVMEALEPDDFYCELSNCDILLTSFGITVYEALYFDRTVFTINPSDYHNSLASSCESIVNIGVAGRKNEGLIRDKLLKFINSFLEGRRGEYKEGGGDDASKLSMESSGIELARIIEKAAFLKRDKCPICDAYPYVYLRDGWINYYYCESCLSFFRSSHHSYDEEYNDDYFTDQYKAQYGKTYLEDKLGINSLNRARLEIISSIFFAERGVRSGLRGDTESRKPRILEIGSAMGFFLEQANEYGFDSYGVELSSYAANYAREELSLSIIEGNFRQLSYEELSFNLEDEGSEGIYDIIVAWYFIEHNRDFISVLEKMKRLIKRGGLLCLSTPNCCGISFLRDREGYIKRVPLDHYIEFSPRSLSILLENMGFSISKVVIKGLHFDRIIRNTVVRGMFSFLRRLILWFFSKRRLGDTFEIYARKEE